MTTRSHCHVTTTLLGALAFSAFIGCGDDDGSGKQCGEGTVEVDGTCVLDRDAIVDEDPDPPDPPDRDAGSGKEDSGPPPQQNDAGPGVSCGDGTIESGGKCIVDPDDTLECGDGTIPQDGKCVVAPPPPPNIESLVVSQLSLRNNGKLIADNDTILQYYPIEVSIGLRYKGDKAKIPVVFALGEPPDPSKTADEQPDLGFCLVGGFDIDHPGGTDATETIASATLQIPKGCLAQGENERTVSPIVMIDPDRTVGAKDQNAVTRRIAFVKQNETDADVSECRIDATEGAAKGTCRIAAKVDESPGLDFELTELTAESSVVVLDKCADGADPDRPVSYRCNSSIVPDLEIVRDGSGNPILDSNGNTQFVLDSDGDPVQETYDDNGTERLRFVYGAADLALDVTLMTYGEDDSDLTNADQADSLADDADEDAVNNVLEDHGLQIEYRIRPANSEDDTAWKPLYLHKQGEQAKADGQGESGQDTAEFEETEAVPATPHYYSHGLYVENDCGERNQATCDSALNPRTDIISGDWADQTQFLVRACIVPVDESGVEDTEIDENPDNNCREIPIRIVRHDTSGGTSMASSYAFNYQWGDGTGSQNTLRLSWGFHTWNKVDTAGATTDNEGAITLGSDLIGYTDILKGWAKGAALVSIVGSYYDYGISTFGIKLWGDAREIPEFHWEQDWNVSKELRKGTIVWAGVVPVSLEIRFNGQAGVVVNVDIVGANTPLNPDEESESFLIGKTAGASRIGLAQLAVTPYGFMTVTASAAVSAVVVRVGVAGQLTLVNLRVPATGRLWWGLTSLSPVNLRLGTWADLKVVLSVMSGRIYLFAENLSLNWCSSRVNFGWWSSTVWYPCGTSWNTFWDFTIASWSGWTWNQTLWASPYFEANIP